MPRGQTPPCRIVLDANPRKSYGAPVAKRSPNLKKINEILGGTYPFQTRCEAKEIQMNPKGVPLAKIAETRRHGMKS
jgi:hypothetical protein